MTFRYAFLLAGLFALPMSASAQKSAKATICHIPPGNPDNRHTISVSQEAVTVHLGHGDTRGTCAFEGSGEADGSITASADDPLAPSGSPIGFDVVLQNDGPDDMTNIGVQIRTNPPEAFTAAKYDPTFSDFNPATGSWTIPWIEGGASFKLRIEGTATDELPILSAGITASDQVDPDPSDSDTDPQIAAQSSGSTSGADGGLESDRRLAALVHARNFARDEARREGKASPPLPLLNLAGKTSGLIGWLPLTAGLGSTPHLSTPPDLVGATNAQDVVAADYLTHDGSRVGAVLLLKTLAGEVYDHSKVICDRLIGATLEGVRITTVDGFPFVLTALRHESGAIDYAVSFAIYPHTGGASIESRFRNQDYTPDRLAADVVNVQLWTPSPHLTVGLVHEVLEQLRSEGSVSYWGPEPTIPQVVVQRAVYLSGVVQLMVDNRSNRTDVVLAGTRTDSEQSEPEPFQTTISVPANSVTMVEIPSGSLYDIGFTLDAGLGDSVDEVYLADGSWGAVADAGGGTISRFEVVPRPLSGDGDLARSIHLEAEVRTWIAVFRYLRPSGLPADLGQYDALLLDGSTTGRVRMAIEFLDGNGVSSVNLYPALGENSTQLQFDLRLVTGVPREWLEAVTRVVFYLEGDGISSAPSRLSVESLAFGHVTSSTDSELNSSLPDFQVGAAYPNPFRGSARIPIRLDNAGMVHATLFDMLGRQVQVLYRGWAAPGSVTLSVAGQNLAPGMYTVRLVVDGMSSSTPLLRLR